MYGGLHSKEQVTDMLNALHDLAAEMRLMRETANRQAGEHWNNTGRTLGGQASSLPTISMLQQLVYILNTETRRHRVLLSSVSPCLCVRKTYYKVIMNTYLIK